MSMSGDLSTPNVYVRSLGFQLGIHTDTHFSVGGVELLVDKVVAIVVM